ncbi:MAG: hypothetical protein LUC87_00650 [Clostridiales bacterium]|nr:hypothetical protein [Clostridiales bacterium]MCD8368258.1 hypothetical protein [Clostridiales bacterium]
MNGVLFDRPALWGKGWSLYRRQTGTDSYGDPTAVYPDEPDYSAEAGSAGAVAWQQSSGSASVVEAGEQEGSTAAGVVYDSALELAPFDRVEFDGALWEITTVSTWLHCRRVEVKRVWA